MPPIHRESTIKRAVHSALATLMQRDIELLEREVSERAMVHRIGCYLQDEFPEWTVDCEYNRDDYHVKRLARVLPDCARQRNTNITPDIIVHVRGKKENLLVVEVKKKNNGRSAQCDLARIAALMANSHYRYRYGLFLALDRQSLVRATFRSNGTVSDWTPDLAPVSQRHSL